METMKPGPKPVDTKQPEDKGIRVSLLRFCVGSNSKPDIPLVSYPVHGGIGTLGASERISITWLRSLRHFRVVEKSGDPNRPDRVVMIHETWASWVPLD